jgi:hypothetical protein
MTLPLVQCPCGCGAEFIQMVAKRISADALAGRKTAHLGASAYDAVYVITGMPGAEKSTT